MPVSCSIPFTQIDHDNFAELDYRIMGCAYAGQNELGRLCDESVYQSDLRNRLAAMGIRNVSTELPITVTHRRFSKTYFIDLAVENAAIYELKTVKTLTGEHDAQIINYALLLGLCRGKLLNFRPPKVEGRLLGTNLTVEQRRDFQVDTSEWREVTSECKNLLEVLLDLLADWGTYLDLGLYEEALTHFLGGEPNVIQHLPLERRNTTLGTHRFHVHSPGIAFQLTGATNPHELKPHLTRLLAHTQLNALQWINFNGKVIRFATLTRDHCS